MVAVSVRIPVQNSVLIWTRESAGLDQQSAADRAKVKIQILVSWETGNRLPTLVQLRRLANVYNRPLGVFFLSEPIANEKLPKLPDFRRRRVRESVSSAALSKAIIRGYRQRSILQDLAEDSGAVVEMPFTLASSTQPDRAGETLRDFLTIEKILPAVTKHPDDFYRALVNTVEDHGIHVIQFQGVPINEARGFSLGSEDWPLIAINGADSPRGKTFTLLHELAHIGLHTDGLCDLHERASDSVERFCDETAAATLLPKKSFLNALGETTGSSTTVNALSDIGRPFGASGEATLIRMIQLNRANWADYRRLKPGFEDTYSRWKLNQKDAAKGREPAPIYYPLKVRDLGRRFVKEILDAHREDLLSSRDTANLLEIKYDKLPRLAEQAGASF